MVGWLDGWVYRASLNILHTFRWNYYDPLALKTLSVSLSSVTYQFQTWGGRIFAFFIPCENTKWLHVSYNWLFITLEKTTPTTAQQMQCFLIANRFNRTHYSTLKWAVQNANLRVCGYDGANNTVIHLLLWSIDFDGSQSNLSWTVIAMQPQYALSKYCENHSFSSWCLHIDQKKIINFTIRLGENSFGKLISLFEFCAAIKIASQPSSDHSRPQSA